MKAKASAVAQKLLNLYRQAHVITGGWDAVNRVFMDEATDEVLTEITNLPTGKLLVQHIKNLRDGKTPKDSIARELLPYGGMMADITNVVDISSDDIDLLISAINDFEPNQDALDDFMTLPIIRKFGPDWVSGIKNTLNDNPNTLKKFDTIVQTWTAYQVWNRATDIMAKTVNDRVRAQLQVDMPEYETYLPMFGEEGEKLLKQLRKLTSSLPSQEPEA